MFNPKELSTIKESLLSEFTSFKIEFSEEYGLEITGTEHDFILCDIDSGDIFLDLDAYQVNRLNYIQNIIPLISKISKQIEKYKALENAQLS